MEQIGLRSLTVAFVFLVVNQSVSSQLEGNIGEFHFTIPNVMGNVDYAANWCKGNNSALAVVNDSNIQTALSQFLNSSHVTSALYINVKLHQNRSTTWFLINGTRYIGNIENQGPGNTRNTNYLLYGRLTYFNNGNKFLVAASAPSDLRNYICEYEEDVCSNNSATRINYNGRCFVKYDTEQFTWYQARERCINNSGDLAQFQGTYTSLFSASWLSKSLTYWVGIRWNDWSWRYSEDGQEYIFTSWSDGKPNNYNYSCVCVDPAGNPPFSWINSDCTTEKQFVCLNKAAVETTTVIATTTITTTRNPTTTVGLVTTITGRSAITENNNLTIAVHQMSMPVKIGLAVGIPGGVLILLIVVVVVIILIKKRERRSNGGSELRSEVDTNAGDNDKIQNGVYAAVVPGRKKGKQTDSPSETIYTSPVFTEKPNSTSPDYNYETANLVDEPYAISTVRGQTKSIYPQGYNDFYANAKEGPNVTD